MRTVEQTARCELSQDPDIYSVICNKGSVLFVFTDIYSAIGNKTRCYHENKAE